MWYAPLLLLIPEKYPDDPPIFDFLLEKAQTYPSLSVWCFEPSKFMRSSLTQTDVFRFFRFGFFDAAS